jgi:hypothetical protein
MLLAEDQHAVQKLAAQGADEPFTGRIHTWSLDRCAQNPGASGLEDGVERGGEVRAAVAEQEPDVLEPLAEGKSEVAGKAGSGSRTRSPAPGGGPASGPPGAWPGPGPARPDSAARQ